MSGSLADKRNMIETTYRSAELVYRAGEDGEPDILEGRMVPYNQWTEIRSSIEGHFMERVLPGSLAKTLQEKAGRLKVLFEHGFSRSLDRAPLGVVASVDDQDEGPFYRATLLRSVPAIIADGIRAGLYGTSVALRGVKVDVNPNPDKSEYNPEGIPEHSIREASLKEISVVTFPAYEGATAALARSVTDDLLWSIVREDPAHWLEIARKQQAEAEPTHSEPDDQEDPGVEASRATPRKPTKDYLSDTEESPSWKI